MIRSAGIDIGTGGARCVVVDEQGRVIGCGVRPWRYRADADGFPSLDPRAAFDAIASACRDAAASCDGDVASIGVTSQRTGVVLLDEDGRELAVSPNADPRGLSAGLELERAHGRDVYRIAGRLPVMLYLPARLAWFRDNRPDVAARVARAVAFSDWLVFRLTGAACTEPTQAAEMLLYDVAEGGWSAELLESLGVPNEILPELRARGEAAGELRVDDLGFPRGTPVVAAGADTQCAVLAMGALEPGDAVVVAGTTLLCARVREDAAATQRWFWTSPHTVDSRFVREAHCGEAGAALQWAARVCGVDVAAFAAGAVAAAPGAGGLAFFDAWPSDVSDFPLVRTGSLQFPAPLLALGRGRDDLARAVCEGTAFGARAGLELLSEHDGPLRSIAIAGGVSRAHAFVAAMAGASDTAVRVATSEQPSALGAAIVAAAGHHGGIREAAVAMRDPGREVAPPADAGYASLYASWKERAAALDAASTRLSHVMP